MSKFENGGIVARLKEFISNKRYKQKEIAQIMDVPPSRVSEYLSGKALPQIDGLYFLAKNGCDINWLLTGESIKGGKSQSSNITDVKNSNISNNMGIDSNINNSDKIAELEKELSDCREMVKKLVLNK